MTYTFTSSIVRLLVITKTHKRCTLRVLKLKKYKYSYSKCVLCTEFHVAHLQTKFFSEAARTTSKVEQACSFCSRCILICLLCTVASFKLCRCWLAVYIVVVVLCVCCYLMCTCCNTCVLLFLL